MNPDIWERGGCRIKRAARAASTKDWIDIEVVEGQRRAASDAEEVKLKADIRAKEAAKLAAEEEAATKERARAAREAARIKADTEAVKKENEKPAA